METSVTIIPAKQLLTHSRLATFRDCPRKHRFAYTKKRRAVQIAKPLRFGTAWHALLEVYWRARQRHDVFSWAAVLDHMATMDFTGLGPYEHAKMLAMLAAYVSIWDAHDVDVLAVEAQFRFPLSHPVTGVRTLAFDMGGKIDLIIRWRANGRVAVVEHKSLSKGVLIGSNEREALVMDGQVSQYWAGARALGFEPDEVVYDVAVKPKIEPKMATPVEERRYTEAKPAVPDKVLANGTVKPGRAAVPARLYANQREEDETPSEYGDRIAALLLEAPSKWFQRPEVVRLEKQERDYRFSTWAWARAILESERVPEEFVPQNTGTCFKYGRCPYLPVCQHQASIDDETLFRTAKSVHEELDTKEDDATDEAA